MEVGPGVRSVCFSFFHSGSDSGPLAVLLDRECFETVIAWVNGWEASKPVQDCSILAASIALADACLQAFTFLIRCEMNTFLSPLTNPANLQATEYQDDVRANRPSEFTICKLFPVLQYPLCQIKKLHMIVIFRGLCLDNMEWNSLCNMPCGVPNFVAPCGEKMAKEF